MSSESEALVPKGIGGKGSGKWVPFKRIDFFVLFSFLLLRNEYFSFELQT